MKIKMADILARHAWSHASEQNQMLRHAENFTPGTKPRPISYFDSEEALKRAALVVFKDNLDEITEFRKDNSATQIEIPRAHRGHGAYRQTRSYPHRTVP